MLNERIGFENLKNSASPTDQCNVMVQTPLYVFIWIKKSNYFAWLTNCCSSH